MANQCANDLLFILRIRKKKSRG